MFLESNSGQKEIKNLSEFLHYYKRKSLKRFNYEIHFEI